MIYGYMILLNYVWHWTHGEKKLTNKCKIHIQAFLLHLIVTKIVFSFEPLTSKYLLPSSIHPSIYPLLTATYS